MATWRDHDEIVDAIEAKDLEEARSAWTTTTRALQQVIANNRDKLTRTPGRNT